MRKFGSLIVLIAALLIVTATSLVAAPPAPSASWAEGQAYSESGFRCDGTPTPISTAELAARKAILDALPDMSAYPAQWQDFKPRAVRYLLLCDYIHSLNDSSVPWFSAGVPMSGKQIYESLGCSSN